MEDKQESKREHRQLDHRPLSVEQQESKQKVTLYLSPELHRQLKVQAAVEVETMSAIAERAVSFYLANPEVVELGVSQGQTHRVYSCPTCATSVVLRDGDLMSLSTRLGGSSGILSDEAGELLVGTGKSGVVKSVSGSGLSTDADESQRDSEQLVPC